MRRYCKEINYRVITINTVTVHENCSGIGEYYIDVRDVLELKSTIVGYWLNIGVWKN